MYLFHNSTVQLIYQLYNYNFIRITVRFKQFLSLRNCTVLSYLDITQLYQTFTVLGTFGGTVQLYLNYLHQYEIVEFTYGRFHFSTVQLEQYILYFNSIIDFHEQIVLP